MVTEGFLELLDPTGTKKSKRYLATKRGLSALPIIIEMYLFSIHSIDECGLDDSQMEIKKAIIKDRSLFEKTKREAYLKFIKELK